MDPLTIGAIAAGGTALASLWNGKKDREFQKEANKENIKEAHVNRDWQERMSNSAYQRATDDMKKAGLNPMLAYTQGGASSPSGAQGSVEAIQSPRFAQDAMSAFSGIASGMSQVQQAKTAQAQAQSSIALQGAQAANTVAATAKTQADTEKTIDSIKNQKVARKLQERQIPLAEIQEKSAKAASRGLEKIEQTFLRNTAKPKMDPKTLQYKKPWYENTINKLFGDK